MRKLFILFVLAYLCSALYAGTEATISALLFKQNKSQWNAQVLYAAELQNGNVFLCSDSFTFLLYDTADLNRIRRAHTVKTYADRNVRVHIFRQVFEGANASCTVQPSTQAKEYFNYYLGKDRTKWASHVNAYQDLNYHDLYNGIDLQVTSLGVNMKYSLVANPGSDPALIAMHYVGTDGISINDGNLVIKTSIGDITDTKPYAYQMVDGKEQQVSCNYVIKGGKVGFVFPDGYDASKQLIIDPTLVFSTFSGSTSDNFGYCATYDQDGNTYVAGNVFGNLGVYPTTVGAFQTTWGGGHGYYSDTAMIDGDGVDISITKYDTAGHTRIYSTYLGGSADEMPSSLIVNANDELYVFGTTASNNFPVTQDAYDTSFRGGPDPGMFDGNGVWDSTGSDIFITHFNADGSALIGSTYIGGTGNDGLNYPSYQALNYNYNDINRGDMALDRSGHVYVATMTRSVDFPVTVGAYQTTHQNSASDGVVFKMDERLSHLLWSTYLGGNKDDDINSIDIDPVGNIYVAGGTISTNFPVTAGSLQTTSTSNQATGFISHLSADGSTLLHSTYYGNDTSFDQVYFVRVGPDSNVYVFGTALGNTAHFIHNAAYSNDSSGQFISKLAPALDSVIWSTTFGSGSSAPDISPVGLTVDKCNNVYVGGWGSDFHDFYGLGPFLSTRGLQTTPNAYRTTTDSNDFYIMALSNDASTLIYATFFGSPTDEDHVDGGNSRYDNRGVIYEAACAGCANALTNYLPDQNYPTTTGAASTTNTSPNCNNAVFKLDLNMPIVAARFLSPPVGCAPYQVSFNNISQTVLSPDYQWDFGDGTYSTQANPSHQYTQPGIYTVTLIVTDVSSCNLTDSVSHRVLVLGSGNTPDTLAAFTNCPVTNQQIGFAPFADTGLYYLWTPSTGLSQANVSDPFCSDSFGITYHLVVYDQTCADTFVQTIGCPLADTTGIKNISNGSGFEVFPDPAYDHLTVRLSAPAAGDEQFEVIDLYGQIIKTGIIPTGKTQCDIDLSGMASGIYMIRLTNNTGGYSVKKILKL